MRRCSSAAEDQGVRPNTSATPAVGRASPSRIRIVVDLPAPFGPRKPWISPAATVRSRPFRATVWPNRFSRPRVLITADMRGIVRRVHAFVNVLKSVNRSRRRRGRRWIGAAREAATVEPVAHLLGAERLHLEYPTRVVFDEITLGLADGDRIGIVGRNGDGKSSLLRMLSGEQEPDSGRVTSRSGLRVGVLTQSDE